MRPARIFIARLIRFMYSIKFKARSSVCLQVTLSEALQENSWWFDRVHPHIIFMSRIHGPLLCGCTRNWICVFGNEYFYKA
jgi:hypothetical protein